MYVCTYIRTYLYVPDEGSLLPKYRDCTTSNDFELYLMRCGMMLLLLIIYIYTYINIYVYTCMYINIRMYVCIYVHVHMYVYIFIYIHMMYILIHLGKVNISKVKFLATRTKKLR